MRIVKCNNCGTTFTTNTPESDIITKAVCSCGNDLLKELPKPLVKDDPIRSCCKTTTQKVGSFNDPIRWDFSLTKEDTIRLDFSQKEIEWQMKVILDAINTIEEAYGPDSAFPLKQIKNDLQRRINWCVENGIWR